MKTNPIIVALDVDSAEEARALVGRLGEQSIFTRSGMELYAAAGMEYCARAASTRGKEVFLDLEIYDIGGDGEARGGAGVAQSACAFLTIHAVGQVMRAAVEGGGGRAETAGGDGAHQLRTRGPGGAGVLVRGVGSGGDSSAAGDVGGSGWRSGVAARSGRRCARSCGAGGGVYRYAGSAVGGEGKRRPKARVATPGEALRSGANYVVMGRQVTRATDPAAESSSQIGDLSDASPPASRGHPPLAPPTQPPRTVAGHVHNTTRGAIGREADR